MSNRGASLVLRDHGDAGKGEAAPKFRFGPAGGLIGRGAQCSWVLVDPERILSKEHAAISYKDGIFSLKALGRNGVFMNGGLDPIATGVPIPLKVGDRLRLGSHEVVVDEILPEPAATASRLADPVPKATAASPGPSVGPAPQPLAQPRPPRVAGNGGTPGARQQLSEDWETRLGELLRPAAALPQTEGARPPPASRPLGELPPPTVTLPPACAPAGTTLREDALAGQQTEWGKDGPLRTLLMGREPLPPGPAPERHDPPWAMETRLFAELLPDMSEPDAHGPAPVEPAAVPDGWTLPPDAAFLRGIGIGLPQLGPGQAAAIAFDLGRALAALSDMLVELSHRQDSPRSNPFASLPTGPLALSELVASTEYHPGQIERMVRERISEARLGRDRAAGRSGAAAIDLTLFEPAKLMARWKLDPRRRDSGARAWAMYETSFPALVEAAKAGQASSAGEAAARPVTSPGIRAWP